MNSFNWLYGCGGAYCTWNNIHLWASDGSVIDEGAWQVYRLPAVYDDPNRIDWEKQAPGKNLQDAQRRAQAAAMVLHQLSEMKHGRRDETDGATAPQGEAQP